MTDLLRVSDACRRLGLSRVRVYELINTGQLPSVKIGRSRRIVEDDLVRFIEERRVPHAS